MRMKADICSFRMSTIKINEDGGKKATHLGLLPSLPRGGDVDQTLVRPVSKLKKDGRDLGRK